MLTMYHVHHLSKEIEGEKATKMPKRHLKILTKLLP